MSEGSASILVVDDDEINRMVLSHDLEREGHRVTAVEDGGRALEALRAQPFDVVLLDVLMPELDGYETLARIERDEKLRHVPVIMVSALEDIESVVRCIELGAADYLPKPFDPVLLRARINGCLTKKRLHDLEREYIEQVGYVVDAATAVENGTFDPETIDAVAARNDALGRLARAGPEAGGPPAPDRDRRGKGRQAGGRDHRHGLFPGPPAQSERAEGTSRALAPWRRSSRSIRSGAARASRT